MSTAKIFFVIAGEPSGDALGAALMVGLKALQPDVRFVGVGGPLMESHGLHSLFPMHELAVMGLAEVLPKLRSLLARVRQCADAVTDANPSALITIDSPDFTLRVARRVRRRNRSVPIIHYVAPSVWAWRPKRAHKMARRVDHVLALLPFEPPLMQAAGVSCDFVGHPAADVPVSTPSDMAALRRYIGINDSTRLLCVLPGSRRGEIARMGPVFGAVVARLARSHKDVHVVVPAAANVAAELAAMVARWDGNVSILDPNKLPAEQSGAYKRAAFATSELALATSGTVSLELAAAGTPMIIAFRFNALSNVVIQRMMQTDTVTLPNLVTDTRHIPEFLAGDCRADLIAPMVQRYLDDPDLRARQKNAADLTMRRLGRGVGSAGSRAAQSVLDFIG